MSPLTTLFADLLDDSTGLVLLVKWTAVLALAWLAHGVLAGRNPRSRVALWRSAIIGLPIVAILAAARPLVTYRSGPRDSPSVEGAPKVPTAPTVDRQAAAIISKREPTVPISSEPAADSSTVTIRRNEPAAVPASTQAQRFLRQARLVSWLWLSWMAGIVVLMARLILGSLGLARVIRRSSAVPDEIVGECRMIADRLDCHRAVAVRRTLDVATPCLAGLWRPVLLLPERECEDVRSNDLRAILAHELAHARNHDLVWNRAAHIASILLWFHPLAWRVRAVHAAACDAVCDAVAADLLGDVASYGRTLARLAVRAAWLPPAHGLAMARTSGVRRRLDALNRKVFRAPLSWRHVIPAIFIGSALLVLIGGFGFSRAEQAAVTSKAIDVAKPTDEKTEGKMTLRVVSADANEPMEGVAITYNGFFGEKRVERTVATGQDGTVTIEFPSAPKASMLEITASAPGHVPIFNRWDRFGKPVKIPVFQDLRFERGTPIGGIVKNEAGKPIVGATIYRYSPPTKYEGARVVFMRSGPTTDGQGRWRMDDAPTNLGQVTLEAVHKDYQTGSGPASRDLDSAIILKKGFSVRGRVVDSGGRAVGSAKVAIGRSYWGADLPTATTDARGEFVVERCAEGPTVVTVQAEEFAPQLREVRVDERLGPVNFRLERGATLRLRVIDLQGRPITGAFVFGQAWRRYNTIALRGETNADGRFAWRSAPRDAVFYDIGKNGFLSRRALPLIASEREQVITLSPPLTITGHVTDAETGQGLPKCVLIQGVGFKGNDQPSWSRNSVTEVLRGEYSTSFDEPQDSLHIRIEALGYKPAVSRAFRPDEGAQSVDFALERAEMLSGIVLLPVGKPAEGVDVVFATGADQVLFDGGRFESRTTAPRAKTGPDGRFAFTATKGNYRLVALGDAGYADASPEEFAKSEKLVLEPWGRLEGDVMAGRRLQANEAISFSPARPDRGIPLRVFTHQYETRTDYHGRFTFDRVIPGPGSVTRVFVTNFGRFSQHISCGGQAVEIRPGQTTTVRIGGGGRPVIGRVVPDGTSGAPIEWMQNPPAFMSRPKREGDVTTSDFIRVASNLEKDGRFRFEDVTSGTYELSLTINDKPDPQVFAPGDAVGSLQMSVTVPEVAGGHSDEPLDLGTITATFFERLNVGGVAPDFAVPRIAGKGNGNQLRLADYRGKLVLLDFWATWCGPCLAEMPTFKDIQKTFDADSRFNLISLAADKNDEEPRKYIRDNGLIWTHGFAGDLATGVGQRYKVHSIPATFLIGPEGRILVKNLRGTELKDAVRNALGDTKLFPAAATPTQQPTSR
jgi:beta-lactamase regulating signal transducer with metallopeptidase domain/thiol-disulfide isomerase/thioredoxin